MTLSERVSKYVAMLEPAVAGQHGHNTTFRAACKIIKGFGLTQDEAWPHFLEFNTRCVPPWSEHDLRRKLAEADRSPDEQPRGYLLAEGSLKEALAESNSATVPKSQPAWPKPNLDVIDKIARESQRLADLWELSPIRYDDGASHAEEIIDMLFPGDPLLCCALSNHLFATRRRETWRGRLADLPLIVPNPMLASNGPTKEGRMSEHSQAATAKRVYLCIEFDFSEKARDGLTDTPVAPLVRAWRDDDIEVIDACAALILHLRRCLTTLACVCHSGGKSLHAWFRVLEIDRSAQKNFICYAVSLGADRATWNKAQFVRIPDGLRETGIRQTAYYLDPKEAVGHGEQ